MKWNGSLVSVFLLFICSGQVYAETITMKCGKAVFQWRDKLLGAEVLTRVEGNWVPWCDEDRETLTIGDKGARCHRREETKEEAAGRGLRYLEQSVIVDFFLLTYTDKYFDRNDTEGCTKLEPE